MNVDSSSPSGLKGANSPCRLWPTLEQLPGLAARAAEWNTLLGDESKAIKPLLKPRAELSVSYPRPDGDPYRLPYFVVEHGPDDHVAVCPDTGDAIAISGEDRIVYEIDRTMLALRVADALGLENSGTSPLSQGAMFLGRYAFANRVQLPAFLALPFEVADLEGAVNAIVAVNQSAFLLFVPTRRFVQPRIEAVVRGSRSALIALAEVLTVVPGGRFTALQALDSVFRVALAARSEVTDVAANRFQKQGKGWLLTFGGKTAQLQDRLGLKYIAHLIAQKHRDVHAAMLRAVASGNDLVRQGSGSELLDDTARKMFGDRYEDLQFRLEEAEQNKDAGAQEKIQQELDDLSRELAAATGLGGRKRRAGDDAEKARKSVSNAIARTLALLEKEHPLLARHLGNSIQMGQFLVYSPETDIDWAM